MKKIISLLVLIPLLGACATNPKLDPNYQQYLETQKTLAQNQPKIVEIKAQPGQTIELKGVQEFIVYAPSSTNRMRIAVHRTPPNPATIIFSKLFDTALDASKSILPAYFGWHYGYRILNKAFDRAGGNYNIGGDYNTGTKYAVQGDYSGADKVMGNKVGQNNYQVGQDYTGQNKATTGQDYVGQNKTDTTTTTTTTTNTTSNTTTTDTYTNGDNSTLTH